MKQSGKLFSLRGSSSLQIPVGAFTSQGDPEHGPDSVKHYMGINEIKMNSNIFLKDQMLLWKAASLSLREE